MTATETSNGYNGQARVVNLDAQTYLSDDTPSQEVIKILETGGCCIIRGVFDKKVFDDISREVHPYVSDRGVLTSAAIRRPPADIQRWSHSEPI